ncbi:hypothetical protein CU044_5055 [Streptomyces sp. L-9-10]|nr:hypothetical protein CU044_5055 [Streptomyces sp. L-9-10]
MRLIVPRSPDSPWRTVPRPASLTSLTRWPGGNVSPDADSDAGAHVGKKHPGRRTAPAGM